MFSLLCLSNSLQMTTCQIKCQEYSDNTAQFNMDPGLSSRMQRTLETHPHGATPPKTIVDLSSAQNEVLRPELLEFFKSTIEDQVASSVR
jgi:hypothetical protein